MSTIASTRTSGELSKRDCAKTRSRSVRSQSGSRKTRRSAPLTAPSLEPRPRHRPGTKFERERSGVDGRGDAIAAKRRGAARQRRGAFKTVALRRRARAQPRSAAPPARRFLGRPARRGAGGDLLVVSAPRRPDAAAGPIDRRGPLPPTALSQAPGRAGRISRRRSGRADPKWLAPQFAGGIVVPRFSSDELTLLGARIAPGTTTSAAFLVYEDRRGETRRPADRAPRRPRAVAPDLAGIGRVSLAAWTDAGEGFAAAGSDPEAVAALTRLIERTPAPR